MNIFGTGKTTKKDLRKPMIGSGVQFQSGYFMEEYSSQFYGRRKYKTYKEMCNDSSVYTAFKSIVTSSKLGKYDVVGEDKDIEEFTRKALFDKMNYTRPQFLETIKNKWRDGNSVFEIGLRYDKKDKAFYPKLKYRRAQNIEKREMSNKQPGIRYEAYVNGNFKYIDIPASKLMLFNMDNVGGELYEGQSIFRRVAKDRYYKTKLETFEMIRSERQSVPVIKVKTSPHVSEDQRIEAIENASMVRAFESGVLEELMDSEGNALIEYEFMDTKASSSETKIKEKIEMYDQNIKDIFFATFLYLGKSSTGSYNQSSSAQSFFFKGIQSDTYDDLEVINQILIPLIVKYNFGEMESYPRVVLKQLGDVDINVFADTISKISSSGMITYDLETENEIREIMNLREKQEDGVATQQDSISQDADVDQIDENNNVEASESLDHIKLNSMLNNNILKNIYDNMSASESRRLKKRGLKINKYEEIASRPLTIAERKVNLVKLSEDITEGERVVDRVFDGLQAYSIGQALDRITRAINTQNIQLFEVPADKPDQETYESMLQVYRDMFESGRSSASNEIAVETPAQENTTKQLMENNNRDSVNYINSAIFSAGIVSVKEAIAKRGGDISLVNRNELVGLARDAMETKSNRIRGAITTPYTSGALNMGRESVFAKNPEKIYAMQYSAILDSRTTARCRSLDGKVVRYGTSEYYDYSPPQHPNCRSIRVSIGTEDEFKPDITGIPSSIPAKSNMLAPETIDQ